MNRISSKTQKMNRISSKAQRILKSIFVFFVLLLVLSSGSWVADGVKGEVLFSDWPFFFREWGLLIAFVVFFAASGVLYWLRRTFANIQSLSQHLCDPHKSLILFVSPPFGATLNIEKDGSRTLSFQDGTKIQLSDDLQQDIAALDKLSDKRWNWQQMMRAIQPHIYPKKRLRRLHLIGSADSKGSKGSFVHLDTCKKWLEGYLSDVEITTIDKPGVDIDDFDAMVRHIQETIKKQKKGGEGKEKFTDKDIVIDVTGGTTTASIAGASSTLNTKVTFQYVLTTPPHEVYAYDVAYLSHDE